MKFSLKCLYLTKTEATVTLLFIWTIIIFAYLVRIFEVPAYRTSGTPSFDSYFNSVWFTVITLTTTGYGDLFPESYLGKIVVIILVFWGVVLLASFVVAMSCLFDLDGSQKMALRHIQINRQAGKAILLGFKFFIARKRLHLLKGRKT